MIDATLRLMLCIMSWQGDSTEDRAERLVQEIVEKFDRWGRSISEEDKEGNFTITMHLTTGGHGGFHPGSWDPDLTLSESELLSLGSPAGRRLLGVLENPRLGLDARIRLALLIGFLRDPSALQRLFALLDSAPRTGDYHFEWYLTAIGLIGSDQALPALRTYLDKPGFPRRMVAWAMGMCGSSDHREEYMEIIEGLLIPKAVTNVYEGLGMTWHVPGKSVLDPPPDRNIMTRYAVETEENKTLYTDLWRLSRYNDPRALKVLIDSLRYPSIGPPDMARWVLERKVTPLPYNPSWYQIRDAASEPELHEHWAKWWQEHHGPNPLLPFLLGGGILMLLACFLAPWPLCPACRGVPFGATSCTKCRMTPGRSSLFTRILRRHRAKESPAA